MIAQNDLGFKLNLIFRTFMTSQNNKKLLYSNTVFKHLKNVQSSASQTI